MILSPDKVKDGGVKVARVQSDSPAEKAGVKPDDVILEFDGKKLNSVTDLQAVLAKKKPGDTVKLKIKRGDKTLELKVKLGKRE